MNAFLPVCLQLTLDRMFAWFHFGLSMQMQDWRA